MRIIPEFPETSPASLGEKELEILRYILKKEYIYQTDLNKWEGFSKSVVSKAKSNLIRLGWIYTPTRKDRKNILILHYYKKEEIKVFLRQINELKRRILVRPHNIRMTKEFQPKVNQRLLRRVVERITKKHHVTQTNLRNDTKYSIHGRSGTIDIRLKSKKIVIYLKDFILPISHKDLDNLEDYINEGIDKRLTALSEEFEGFFCFSDIKFSNLTILNNFEIGIIEKTNANEALYFRNKMKELGMTCDKSVRGCDEFEIRGKLDEVLDTVTKFSQFVFQFRRDKLITT